MNIPNSQSNLPSPKLHFVYRCTHSHYHPNLGKMLTKGNLYQVSSINTNNDTIQMIGRNSGCACCTEFFQTHFEEVYTSDSPQARKLYVAIVVNELIHKVDTIFDRTKCNCANEIIAEFAKEMQERWGDNR